MDVSNGMVILLGLGIVFFGLICIIVLCTIMGAIVRKFAKKPEAPAAAPAPAPAAEQTVIPNRREMVAAISAAIAEELGVEVSGIKILSIKKI